MVNLFINPNKSLENLILVINSKRLSNVIKRYKTLDLTWKSGGGLHVWL